MSYMKDGLLLALGGFAGLALAALLEANAEDDDEPKGKRRALWDEEDDEEENEDDESEVSHPSLDGVIKSLRADAEAALAACATDEEREAVYDRVEDKITELKDALDTKCEAIIAELRRREDEDGLDANDDAEENLALFGGGKSADDYEESIRKKVDKLTEALDEILSGLKGQTV